MAVPQYTLPLCTMLGELVTWYGFAEKTGIIGPCGGTAIAVPYITEINF